MTRKMSRKEFIKTASIGAAATAVLTGCGPASRYVVREPYTRMPEYTYNGTSTYYATTCRECPDGCGIVVRTEQGRALKVEGNPNHPVNLGKTCSRGQATLQGLYNPDRIRNPVISEKRGNPNKTDISWDEAINLVSDALKSNSPDQVAFLLGMAPDHLFDVISELCAALGAPPPVRFSAHEIFDALRTLQAASKQLFSADTLPYFDLTGADVIFSFGANFLETYLSPMVYSRGFAKMRRGTASRRGYMVQFEPRLSQTAACADEWIPIKPGTEGLVALAIGQIVAQTLGETIPIAYIDVKIEDVATACDVPVAELQRLAGIFATASHPIAVPGGATFGFSNGLESTQAVLALNAQAASLGKQGNMFLSPATLVKPEIAQLPNSIMEVNELIRRMHDGKVKALFIHGFNPLFELPGGMEIKAALDNVSQIFSFSSFMDETALQSDYIFPDHTGLESWGYQKVHTADRIVISGYQPTVVPFYSTKATTDVLLASVQAIGGSLASALPYKDEVEYIQNSLANLVGQSGAFNAPEIKTFMSLFQQNGGWWNAQPALQTPDITGALNQLAAVPMPDFLTHYDFYLIPFMSPILGDGSGANRPWLQETPDPTTTVMWNSWVEINPQTADLLGLENDDVVKLISEEGEIEVAVYRYPGIRPDTFGIPFGQGHTAFGRYASSRGVNPFRLLSLAINGADDLAFGSTKVYLQKTGRKQPLSRLESRMGVYGEGIGE